MRSGGPPWLKLHQNVCQYLGNLQILSFRCNDNPFILSWDRSIHRQPEAFMDRDAQIHTQHKTMRFMKVSTQTHKEEMRLQHIWVFTITLQAYLFNDTENSSCCVCFFSFILLVLQSTVCVAPRLSLWKMQISTFTLMIASGFPELYKYNETGD